MVKSLSNLTESRDRLSPARSLYSIPNPTPMKSLFAFPAACLLALAACSPAPDKSANYLVGAWSWERSSYSGEDTSYVWTNVDGQIVFTDKHYSLIWINRDTPRDTTGNRPASSFSHEELKDILRGVASNAGSYQIEADSIAMYRDVALYPNPMAPFNQPTRIPLPVVIKPDTLIWRANGNENVWVRLK